MTKTIFVILLIFISYSFISCKKQSYRYSYINELKDIQATTATIESYFHLLAFDRLTYGICWSDTTTIPVLQRNYPEYGDNNYALGYYLKKQGAFDTINLTQLPRGKTLRVRSFIELKSDELLYSENFVEFKTKLFNDLPCELNENQISISGSKESVVTNTKTWHSNGLYEITTTTNNYTFKFWFYGIPNEYSYRIEDYNPSDYYNDHIKVEMFNTNNQCEYRMFKLNYFDDFYLYTAIQDSDYLILKFCNANFEPYGSSCPSSQEISGHIKIEL